MENMGLISLIPPVLAIGLSIAFRRVEVSLFAALFVGLLIILHGNPVDTSMSLVKDYLIEQATDSYNAGVLVLLFFIGGFVALVEKSGGGNALAERSEKLITSRTRAQFATWLGSLAIFFSDLGTPLILGPIFENIYDKVKSSREKLAWILDSTMSPVAVLIPFIGWGIYIMGLIADAFDRAHINASEFTTFVHVIPFQMYAILTVLSVPVVIFANADFGPMRRAEARTAYHNQRYWPGSKPLRGENGQQNETPKASRATLIWLPLAVLFTTLFGILISQGFPVKQVPGNEFRAALSTAYLFAAITLVVLMLLYKVSSLGSVFSTYVKGMERMINVVIILVLAWSLGALLDKMGTANYIVEILQGNIPGFLVPALVFIAAGLMSFATGSSWGTFAIMIPLAIPIAQGLNAPMLVCIGAVLSGGIFGDHCSPISDSTILASTGAAADHIDHVRTQIPYALTNGTIVLLMFIVAGITASPYTVVLGVILMIVSFVTIGRLMRKRDDAYAQIPQPQAH
ncbi:Na+/H+ antiporter NhaC family protein [Gleimia hominis]|uniref:Na+/H+ antiporter NhaC family protein n=1 Tax=Gleimia hominis TaxID=595468 RepID=A0ABU3IB84_9ACTO|nr:Na+/H+ antiporter NhaC family protein [Gleimia hominis]MDT3767640.1 Na+/H+ antiporter NhaC family protein [Gleimia hominis]